MAVVVFDADVLIAYLNRDDAQHAPAVERVRAALEPGARRLVSAVNYTEVLIGPLRARGREHLACDEETPRGLGSDLHGDHANGAAVGQGAPAAP